MALCQPLISQEHNWPHIPPGFAHSESACNLPHPTRVPRNCGESKHHLDHPSRPKPPLDGPYRRNPGRWAHKSPRTELLAIWVWAVACSIHRQVRKQSLLNGSSNRFAGSSLRDVINHEPTNHRHIPNHLCCKRPSTARRNPSSAHFSKATAIQKEPPWQKPNNCRSPLVPKRKTGIELAPIERIRKRRALL